MRVQRVWNYVGGIMGPNALRQVNGVANGVWELKNDVVGIALGASFQRRMEALWI